MRRTPTLLCEPNVSEGRDPDRIRRLADSLSEAPVDLVHCSADPDHNRMVLAYRGEPDHVVAATVALARAAFEEIDLRLHEGRHPRVGALDVVPFVAEAGDDEAEDLASGACRKFGRAVGALGVPVFFYERSASAPHRRPLPAVRRGGFEGLAEKMERTEWRPDEGPPVPHPSAGAVIAGVRHPLVRFNVNLADPDPSAAITIAAAIRESSGGLPNVRALGLALTRRSLSQVTMNLTDYRVTSLARAYEAVRERAAAAGVEIAGVEVIGPIPQAALAGVGPDIMKALDPTQILQPVEDEIA